MPDPLTHTEIAALEEASRFLASGAVQAAAEKLATTIRAGSRHPDILLVYASACERLSLPAEALGALQLAIQQDADRAELWAQFGRLLVDAGRAAEAVPALERAVALTNLRKQARQQLMRFQRRRVRRDDRAVAVRGID